MHNLFYLIGGRIHIYKKKSRYKKADLRNLNQPSFFSSLKHFFVLKSHSLKTKDCYKKSHHKEKDQFCIVFHAQHRNKNQKYCQQQKKNFCNINKKFFHRKSFLLTKENIAILIAKSSSDSTQPPSNHK